MALRYPWENIWFALCLKLRPANASGVDNFHFLQISDLGKY